jgi:hypothetical protein
MVVIYIFLALFVALAVIFFVLWMSSHNDIASREREYQEIKDMRETMGRLFYRLSVIDGKLPAPDENAKQYPSPEPKSHPLTTESVRTALRYNRFTLDPANPEEPDIVYFNHDDVHYRLNTRSLPYLSIEVGFRYDTGEENIALMKQIAQEITYQMFIAKVFVSEEGYYVFQADMMADDYLKFRNNLRCYIDVLTDAQRRFAEMYNTKIQEQNDAKEKALQTTLLAAQTDAAGNKLLS